MKKRHEYYTYIVLLFNAFIMTRISTVSKCLTDFLNKYAVVLQVIIIILIIIILAFLQYKVMNMKNHTIGSRMSKK